MNHSIIRFDENRGGLDWVCVVRVRVYIPLQAIIVLNQNDETMKIGVFNNFPISMFSFFNCAPIRVPYVYVCVYTTRCHDPYVSRADIFSLYIICMNVFMLVIEHNTHTV